MHKYRENGWGQERIYNLYVIPTCEHSTRTTKRQLEFWRVVRRKKGKGKKKVANLTYCTSFLSFHLSASSTREKRGRADSFFLVYNPFVMLLLVFCYFHPYKRFSWFSVCCLWEWIQTGNFLLVIIFIYDGVTFSSLFHQKIKNRPRQVSVYVVSLYRNQDQIRDSSKFPSWKVLFAFYLFILVIHKQIPGNIIYIDYVLPCTVAFFQCKQKWLQFLVFPFEAKGFRYFQM